MKKKKTFIAVMVLLLFCGAVGFISYFSTPQDTSTEIKNFPRSIGGWTSTDIPLTDRVYQLLETKNLIMREYKNQKGDVVTLYIIYSLTNRKVVHAPEICLQGAGETIVDKSYVQVADSLTAVKLVLEKSLSREIAVYWFRIAGVNTPELLKQQLKMFFDQIRGRNTSISMVRVMTDVKEGNDPEAFARIKSFCALLAPLLPKYLP